jgi:hypothetical protein
MPVQWIEVIINSRSNNSEDVTNLTANDIRNGMLVNPLIHACLELRQVAFLKVSFATVINTS